MITRNDMKLIAHNAARFDTEVVLKKLNSSHFVKTNGSIGLLKEKKSLKNLEVL